MVSVSYTMCYLGSISIMRAYCKGKLHNMLSWKYKDNGSILCRSGTQCAALAVLR